MQTFGNESAFLPHNKGVTKMYTTTLKIDGMMCGMCENHINDTVRRSFDVKKVKSSHGKGSCVIESEDKLDESKLREEIGKTGYDLLDISVEEGVKKKKFLGLF